MDINELAKALTLTSSNEDRVKNEEYLNQVDKLLIEIKF